MSWTKLDDGFADHWKLKEVGPLGGWAHTKALCYSSRYSTNGFIPQIYAQELDFEMGEWYERMGDTTTLVSAELVRMRLWLPVEGGFQINDYLKYNPSREELEAARAEKAGRARKAAEARWGPSKGHHAGSNASALRPHSKSNASGDSSSDARRIGGSNAPVPSRPREYPRRDTHNGESAPTPSATAPGAPPPETEEPKAGVPGEREVPTIAEIAAELGIENPLDPAPQTRLSKPSVEARRDALKAQAEAIEPKPERTAR